MIKSRSKLSLLYLSESKVLSTWVGEESHPKDPKFPAVSSLKVWLEVTGIWQEFATADCGVYIVSKWISVRWRKYPRVVLVDLFLASADINRKGKLENHFIFLFLEKFNLKLINEWYYTNLRNTDASAYNISFLINITPIIYEIPPHLAINI